MAALWIILVILAGAVIGLYFYSKEKPKELQKEIARLRKSIVSEGINFEQVEYRIESLKEEIAGKRKELRKGTINGRDIEKYLNEMEKKLDGIISELFSGKSTK